MARARPADPHPSRLDGIARLVVRRPRRVLAAWVLAIAILGVAGIGLEDKLASHAIYVDGTATKRAHEVSVRHFGSESSVVVLLRGPRDQVARQGRRLERFYADVPGAMVFSPWTGRAALPGLRPSPGSAALVVSVKGHADDDAKAILPSIHEGLDEVVAHPVQASVAGFPAIVDSVERANQSAVQLGELIAVPALLVVLLLVFRSVLAALAPVVVGGAVVIASRGIVDFIAGATHVEILALGATGMMGLALGVDYSLLIVSRFREEARAGASVADAVHRTVMSTGRTVLMAGCGLSLAMLVAPVVLPSAIIFSVSLAILVVTVLSVLSALFVVPAFLVVLGPNLDRWSLPSRQRRAGVAAALSARLSARPALVVLPVLLLLAAAAAWSAKLETDAITVAQLPTDDSGRLQQEEVQRTLGPGWVAPIEIAIRAGDGPVTTPRRLRALVSFQRRLERDPGVETMTGFAEIERSTRGIAGFEQSLAGQQRGLERLGGGLARVRRGARLSSGGLARAADGARDLTTGIEAAHGGTSALGNGLAEATSGSARMAAGLDRASSGSDRVADGAARASEGAGSLSAGLERARRQSGNIAGSAGLLETAMRDGEGSVSEADGALGAAGERLAAAREALQAMTAGRSDPSYEDALAGVESAIAWLTGVDPRSGEASDLGEGAEAGVRRAGGQFSLGLYLTQRLRKSGAEATAGMSELQAGSAKLDRALERLTQGTAALSAAVARLSRGGEELSPGMVKLVEGNKLLVEGIGRLEAGGGLLSDGLDAGAQRSTLLTGAVRRLESGVERQGGDGGSSQLERLRSETPGLFDSGFLYLAGLDGSAAEQRRQAAFLVSLNRGGSAGRMVVVPSYDPADPRASEARDRIEAEATNLARMADAEVVVGGVTPIQLDLDSWLRGQAPVARLALAIVTFAILFVVLRALLVPLLSALLNVLTVAATFGFVALVFNSGLLGGPGYVDTTLLPATIVLVFALAIDYEVFVFSRMREEYLRTGSTESAIAAGVDRTAPVVTGAAIVMIIIFLSFAASSFSTMRSFGVAQAVGVGIDAFLIRLVVVPAMMRALGRWAWWMPAWLDRLLPGVSNSIALAGRGRSL